MILIDCIADCHGIYPDLPSGDLLIIAGDITARDTIPEWKEFFDWLKEQNYEKKILIGGNHDNFLENCLPTNSKIAKKILELDEGTPEEVFHEYLCDSGTEYKGLNIWGSPWTDWFSNVNPVCKAFMDKSNVLGEKFNLIPQDTDILITHTPPIYILDQSKNSIRCGSPELTYAMPDNVSLNIFGHIHECHGQWLIGSDRLYVNACVVDENYDHNIDYVRIVYDEKQKKAISVESRKDLT